jgi:hypothetical protein
MGRSSRGQWLWCALLGTLLLTACGGGNSGSGAGGSGQTSNPQPSFTLSATPATPSVVQGASVTATITVTPTDGFDSNVALSASGLPAGITASFNPSSLSPSSTTTSGVLTLTANGTTSTGTTTVTITGTSGTLTPITTLSLTTTSPTVTISPTLAAVVVTTQTQQFTASVVGPSNTNVNWSVDGTPGGSTAVGTISASGLYMPPATGGTHTVTAASASVPSASASASVAVTDLAGVFTYHNDLARDGANTQEYALTSASVDTTTFGKLFSCPVDGAVYAQPLWVPGFTIGGGVHNLLIVATQNDSVFAFDADASPCVTYWQVNLLDTLHGGAAGENPVVWNEVGNCYGDIYPEIGVTSTPVIDPTTNTIYVISASELGGAGGSGCSKYVGTFYHKLHALDLATGSETFNAPVTIAASVPGTGDGSSNGMVNFESQFQGNRAGLILTGGTVYAAFASHEDATPYHGWLIGYSASNVQQQVAVFNTTPNGLGGADGGIWAGGGAPAVDEFGNIYVSTGNGIYDESSLPPDDDYGDSTIRLQPSSGSTPNGANLSVAGWFTPYNEASLEDDDRDLGSGGPVLLPDQTEGPVAHLLIQIGKQGILYLINRDNMGEFNTGDNNDQIVQSFSAPNTGLWGMPALWQNNLYVGGSKDVLRQFTFDSTTGLFNPMTAVSESTETFGYPGTTPSISSQGASNGIVWTIDASLYGFANHNVTGVDCSTLPLASACSGPAILHAYNATNLGVEYWNSTQAANNRDQAGNAVKFVPPTVANGKVYVGTATEIDVYGLLP